MAISTANPTRVIKRPIFSYWNGTKWKDLVSFRDGANTKLTATLNMTLATDTLSVTVSSSAEFYTGQIIKFGTNAEELEVVSITNATTIVVVRGGTPETASSGADIYVAVSDVRRWELIDSLHSPLMLKAIINNASSHPFSNSGGTSKGPHTGKLLDFTHIKLRDGDTHYVYFYGVAYSVDDSFKIGVGQVISITGYDFLQELSENSGIDGNSYLMDNDANLYDAVVPHGTGADNLDLANKIWQTTAGEGYISSRSGLIKSLIPEYSQNITTPGDANSGDTDRFTESVAKFMVNSTSEKKPYNLNGLTSILGRIKTLAKTEPHTISDSTEITHGFDYYLDPNWGGATNGTNASLADHKPKAFFNYFKKGERPHNTPATYGLSVHYPSPDTTSGGDFTKTTMRVPMTSYDVQRPKHEIYTDATVSYLEEEIPKSTTDGNATSDPITVTDKGTFELLTIHSASNFDDFVDLLDSSEKDISNGTPGTESAEYLKVKIAEVNDNSATDGTGISNSDTGITVDTPGVAGFYVGQYIEIDSEVMKVTAINTGTNTLTATRAQNHPTTGASTSAAEHDNNADIYALEVCRLQWTGLQGGTATVASDATSYVLISDVDERISENSTYWSADTTFKGQTSSSASFEITSRPRTAYGIRRNLQTSLGTIKIPNEQRKAIYSLLERRTETLIRAKFQTHERPFFYFDDSPASVTTHSGSDQTLDLSGSENPQNYGVTAGMLVVKLDANNSATNVYGYVTSTTSAAVRITWSYGTVSASDTVRYYVPVRAGDFISVRNDLADLSTKMLVTKLDHKDENGVMVSRFDTVGIDDNQKTGADARRMYSVDDAETFFSELGAPEAPNQPEPSEALTVTIDNTFSAANEHTVAWTAGTLYVGSRKYAIAAGNTGSITTQAGPYILYYLRGASTYALKTLSDYETATKQSTKYIRIATVEYDIPFARWVLSKNVQGANATKLKAGEILQGQSLEASLLKKGNQQATSNLSFEATGTSGEYNKIKFGQKGSVSSNATISFADNTTETVVHSATGTASLGNSSSVAGGKVTLAAGVNYIYKEVGKPEITTMRVANASTSEKTFEVTSTSNMFVGQMLQISEENLTVDSITDGDTVELNRAQNSTSAQTQALNDGAGNPVKIYAVNDSNKTLKISNTYSDVYQDDRMLLATVVVASSDDGSDSPSIFPFTGNEATVSAGVLAAGAIKADNIQANAITAAKLEANLVLANNIKTSATVNDGSGTDQNGFIINSTGITAFNSAGEQQIKINPTTGRIASGANENKVVIYAGGLALLEDTNDLTTDSAFVMGSSSKYAASGATLAEALDDSEEAVDVSNGALFSLGNVIIVDSEKMLVKSISSNTLTVERDYQGTTAATHADTTAIFRSGLTTDYHTIYDGGSGGVPIHYWLSTTQEAASGTGYDTDFSHSLVIGPNEADKTMFILPSYTADVGTDGVILGASNKEFWALYSGLVYANTGPGAASPAYTFNGDTDTGMYQSAANYLAFATGGALRGRFYSGGLVLDTMGTTSGTDVVVDGSNVVQKKSSSKRYKRNIVDIALDSNKVYDLRPVDFEWNEKSATDGKKDIGLIAEEVAEILPQIVNYNNDKTPESVSYDKLSVILLMEIKKLKEEIEKLKENK